MSTFVMQKNVVVDSISAYGKEKLNMRKLKHVGAGPVFAKKGITLVALIITIIVMLILVGVSVQVVINSDLIGTAQDAADRTEIAYEDEAGMQPITIGGLTYESIEDYLKNEKKLPEFVDSLEECMDINKKYILPDGYMYEYKPAQIANFTNQIPISVDSTGAVYNGVGYKEDTRLSASSGYVESTYANSCLTGFIHVKTGDVIRFANMSIPEGTRSDFYLSRIYVFDTSKVGISSQIVDSYIGIDGWDVIFTNGNLTELVYGGSDGFIRINANIIDAASIITVNEEIIYSTNGDEYAWQRTERYIPEYWYAEVKATVATVNNLKENAGYNVTQFVLTSELHFPTQVNIQNVGTVSAGVMKASDIQFFMNLGDNTPDGFDTDKPNFASYMNAILDILAPIDTKNILMTVGNHDGATAAQTVDGEIVHYGYELNNEERAEVYFGWQKSNTNKKFGPDGTYYYIDDIKSKTRYIMLNSFWTEWEGDENGFITDKQHSFFHTPMFGEEQMSWFATEALDMPSGYAAVIGTHGATAEYTPPRDLQVFKDIIAAYVNKDTYDCDFTREAEWQSYSISGDFSDAKGELIAIFHGHKHMDEIDTTSFVIPFIGITSASAGARDENAPTRTVGTSTETAIDVVTIDRKNRTIYMTRLGVGNDRSINY